MSVEDSNGRFENTSLTFGVNRKTGTNAYDFASRAVHIAVQREKQGIPEGQPFPGGPWTIAITPTDICNAGCEWCFYRTTRREHIASVKEQQKAGDLVVKPYLSKDVVMELLDSLEQGGSTKGTYWVGGGEPLTAPYIAEALLRASTFTDVFLQTNGIQLDKLTKSPESLGVLRLLSISAVGFDESSTQGVHHVNSFSRIDRNVRDVMRMRNEYREAFGENSGLGKLSVNAKIMIDRTNYLGLPQMLKYWRDDLQVDIVAIRPVQDFYYGEDGSTQEGFELSSEQKAELIDLIRTQYSSDKDLTRFAHFLQLRQQPIASTSNCFNVTHGHSGIVDAKGNVYLGNPEIGKPEFSIGNIRKQKWDQIWGSDRHLQVIDYMNSRQIHGICDKEFCRHVTANQGVQEYLDGKRQPPEESEIMDEGLGAFM